MRHHPYFPSLKVTLHSRESLPDLFTNTNWGLAALQTAELSADRPLWWNSIHIMTSICSTVIRLILGFAHSSGSIFNLFIDSVESTESIQWIFILFLLWTEHLDTEMPVTETLSSRSLQSRRGRLTWSIYMGVEPQRASSQFFLRWKEGHNRGTLAEWEGWTEPWNISRYLLGRWEQGGVKEKNDIPNWDLAWKVPGSAGSLIRLMQGERQEAGSRTDGSEERQEHLF